MPRILFRAILTAALGAASLARAAEAAPPFQPTGELILVGVGGGAGASFGADRVVGPNVNLTRRADGTWAGDVSGLNVDLAVTEARITAPNLDLHVERHGDVTTIRGLMRGKVVRLVADSRRVSGRSGACSIDLRRAQGGTYDGDLGCVIRRSRLPQTARSFLRVLGDADDPATRPFPQFALALVSILPG